MLAVLVQECFILFWVLVVQNFDLDEKYCETSDIHIFAVLVSQAVMREFVEDVSLKLTVPNVECGEISLSLMNCTEITPTNA